MTSDSLDTFILIDGENIDHKSLLSINNISSARVYFFHSDNSILNTVKSEYKSILKLKTVYCETTGKNALDFILDSYLGFLIAKHSNSDFYIVSNDLGFDNVVTFWRGRNTDIKRLSMHNSDSIIESRLNKVFKELSESQVSELCDITFIHKSNLNKLHNRLMSWCVRNSLKQSYGTQVYKVIKNLVKEINKS